MNLKCKKYSKRGRNYVVVSSLKNQTINSMGYNLVKEDKIMGLLPLEIVIKHSRFDMVYNVSGLITLKDYLITPLTKDSFCEMLDGILGTLKRMRDYHIGDYQSLLLDFDYVYMNPSSRSVQFLYLPITYYKNEVNFKSFLGSIISRGVFIQGENNEYVSKFIALINDYESFNLLRLEEYVNWLRIGKGSFDDKKPKCRRCNSLLSTANTFCPTCGMKIGDVAEDRFEYVPVINNDIDNNVSPHSNLNSSQNRIGVQAFIVRIQNGIRVNIDKEEFVIGKSDESDLVITGNDSISRTHAKIVRFEDKFYLVDLDSTNGTRLGNEVLPSNKFVELFSDTRFFLSNEEFYFGIEKGE